MPRRRAGCRREIKDDSRILRRVPGEFQRFQERDGRYAAITDFGCETVLVADVATRRVLGPIAGLEGAGIAKILPDNRTAVILLLDERVVAMADLATRRVVARHPLSGPRPDAAAWGPAR